MYEVCFAVIGGVKERPRSAFARLSGVVAVPLL